ncbi:SH3 domain-containing protein [uncultured Desulfosarcina sp.]|uniref:SH3 domain-containing protein n=1 Tax=uncultured Desulfosarcina sp. TaxID=218289 RepID=UPI0029C99DE6|nr:SH3 domain-containing protein [uncultured Desulfosarcina sp.]
MSKSKKGPESKTYRIAAGILLIGLLCACVQRQTQPLTVPLPLDCPPYPTEKIAGLVAQNQSLQKGLASSHAKIDELESKAADLEIRMLQKEAMVNELNRRVSLQQRQLDDAIIEVVRTKSKLRSIESKAETASTIAETEIAVKSMRGRIADTDPEGMEALLKAEQLLKLSTREFKAQNYGGALYLAVQSKNQVSAGDRSLQGRDESAPVAGEVPFDQPLPLKLIKNTNLREGPDFKHKVLATLTAGASIIGYSYKESWIRVDTEDGMTGWVHQTLVMAR